MSHSPLQPPVPFSDFEFTFDPSLSNLFPNPPPLPSSADLFSASETTDILGFLDNFNDFEWDINSNNNSNEYVQEPLSYDHVPTTIAPYSNPHLNTIPDPSTSSRQKPSSHQGVTRSSKNSSSHDDRNMEFDPRNGNRSHSIASDASTVTFTSPTESPASPAVTRSIPPRSKPLLSTPQKRLNHIMSEQKRRNAIRDGYAQLIALLAPAGSAPGIAMPTRGRPKGSGSRGKGQSKGKSGVLFRAVEYCRWLEEGRDTLREEVLRVEAAAGIRHSS